MRGLLFCLLLVGGLEADAQKAVSAEGSAAWLNHQKFYPELSPLDRYPTSRGFDRYFGTIWGVVDLGRGRRDEG